MFVTFYSYKGGVGRTLALAHIAYCLATDAKEPCKVLIWDFDLEAPGLQKIFRCGWRGKKYGFIDLVHQYKDTREVPSINEYIYPTDVGGIDILPAGYQSNEYLDKFSRLSWRNIYLTNDGFSFVEGIKSQILAAKYDYVLIDSRTGYSDVSGICTLQLPDVVALVFRLNDQNLDGIEKIQGIIRGHRKDKISQPIEMIPIVSPRWPFSDKREDAQLKKVKHIFTGEPLSFLTFDPALNYSERIFLRDKGVNQSAQISTDYRRLARRIRTLNSEDPLTIYSSAMDRVDELDFEGAIPKLKALVRMRSDNVSYWTALVRAALNSTQLPMGTKTQEALAEVKELIDAQLIETPNNAGALLAKSILLSDEKGDPGTIMEYLDKALESSPQLKRAHMMRAMLYQESGQFQNAVEDINQLIKMDPKDAAAYSHRAGFFKALGRFKEAERDIAKAINLDPREPHYLHIRARLFLRQEKYEKAEADIKKELSMRPKDEHAILTYCHVLAGQGRTSEASKLLEEFNVKVIGPARRLELAEAWLAIGEPTKSLSALSDTKFDQNDYKSRVSEYIKTLSKIMISGEPCITSDEISSLASSVRGIKVSSWDWTELRLFYKRLLMAQSHTPGKVSVIEQLFNALPVSSSS